MDLAEWRKRASARSGGTSSEAIKRLVLRLLQTTGTGGSLLDFGAGTGELLRHLHQTGSLTDLAGADLFQRPATLPAAVAWHRQDLNEPLAIDRTFDVVVCSETIEHLENPRSVMRDLGRLLKPAGLLILTMPNQESIRSLMGLLFRSHFIQFLGDSYPAHITALLRLDLARICAETGFFPPAFHYTDDGSIPAWPRLSWQRVSFGLLTGRLFSDNLGMVTRKAS